MIELYFRIPFVYVQEIVSLAATRGLGQCVPSLGLSRWLWCPMGWGLTDDIPIFSPTKKQHTKDIQDLLSLAKNHRLVLSKKKAFMAVSTINFLGLQIAYGKLKLHHHLIEKLKDFSEQIEEKNYNNFQEMIFENIKLWKR